MRVSFERWVRCELVVRSNSSRPPLLLAASRFALATRECVLEVLNRRRHPDDRLIRFRLAVERARMVADLDADLHGRR